MGNYIAPSASQFSPFAESRFDMLPSIGSLSARSPRLLRIAQDELDAAGSAILEAFISTGFFVLRTANTGKQELLAEMQTFFKRPVEEKQQYAQSQYESDGGFCGYARVQLGTDATEYQKQLRGYEERDVFDVQLSLADSISWPSPEFQTRAFATLITLHDHSAEIMRVCAKALGIEPEALLRLVNPSSEFSAKGSTASNFSLFRYQDDEKKYASVQKCMAHQDGGFLTLLPKSSFPGIEILDKQTKSFWWSLEEFLEQDDILVYPGQAFAKVTGGMVSATVHRVVRFPGQERFSMPFELKPFPFAVLGVLPTSDAGVVARQREIDSHVASELEILSKDPNYVPDWVVSLPLVSLYACVRCQRHIKHFGYRNKEAEEFHYLCEACYAQSDKSKFEKRVAHEPPVNSQSCLAAYLAAALDAERVLQHRYRVDSRSSIVVGRPSQRELDFEGNSRRSGCLSKHTQELFQEGAMGKIIVGSRRRLHR